MHKTIKYTQKGFFAKTCGGFKFMKAWMLTRLLSSGISGRWRLAYDSESNSKRYDRSILLGRTHDTNHILHSHHAKYFPVSRCHTQYNGYLLRKDSGSSEFFSLLTSTSDFWCQKHHLHQLLLQGRYNANGQPLMVLLDQIWHHIVSIHRIHIQDRSHQFLL